MSESMSDVERLRGLLAKATDKFPLPWRVEPSRLRENARRPVIATPLGYLAVGFKRTHYAEALTGAVETVNALPALLDRLETAEAERDNWRARFSDLDVNIALRDRDTALEALEQATRDLDRSCGAHACLQCGLAADRARTVHASLTEKGNSDV